MTDISLNSITSGYNVNKINDNFSAIQLAVNNQILHLLGGNNVMQQDIDMNSHQLLNVATDPNNPNSFAKISDIDTKIASHVALPDPHSQYLLNVLNTTGDLIYSVGSTETRLGIGATGKVLKSIGGVPTWADETAGGLSDAPIDGNTYSRKNSAWVLVTPQASPSDSTAGRLLVVGALKASLGADVAGIVSPAFTGTPTAPTAPANTNTTQIATTAFVMNRGAGTGGGPDSLFVEFDALQTVTYRIGQNAEFPLTISIATPAVITQTNGFVADQPVHFYTTGALPTGLLPDTRYFVIAAGLSSASYRVSLTAGGAAINTTGTQSGSHTGGAIKNAITANPFNQALGVSLDIPNGSTLSIP